MKVRQYAENQMQGSLCFNIFTESRSPYRSTAGIYSSVWTGVVVEISDSVIFCWEATD